VWNGGPFHSFTRPPAVASASDCEQTRQRRASGRMICPKVHLVSAHEDPPLPRCSTAKSRSCEASSTRTSSYSWAPWPAADSLCWASSGATPPPALWRVLLEFSLQQWAGGGAQSAFRLGSSAPR
jgi:hypothetical protein